MTCILLFLEIELNLVWLLITWLVGGRWRGVWDFWRLLPVPSDLTRTWDRGAPPPLIPFWDLELLAVQVLSLGEAPGRQPLPAPPRRRAEDGPCRWSCTCSPAHRSPRPHPPTSSPGAGGTASQSQEPQTSAVPSWDTLALSSPAGWETFGGEGKGGCPSLD